MIKNINSTLTQAKLADVSSDMNPNLEKCKQASLQLVLMPAGQQSISFKKYLRAHDIEVAFFVDNNNKMHGKVMDGVKVISFEELKRKSSDYQIVVMSNDRIQKILDKQFKSNAITNYFLSNTSYLCAYNHFLPDEIDNGKKNIVQHWSQYTKLYEKLNDQISKDTLISVLNYRITYDKAYIEKVIRPSQKQYFEEDIYNLTGDDCFVDCGAFDGDTFEALMNQTDNAIDAYYGFEPNEHNFAILKEKAECTDNFILFPSGVSINDDTLYFENHSDSTSAASSISDNGDQKVDVVSLDSVLKDKKVTFIKMDIEGAEADALKGAKQIIQEQKPILTISVYHKFNDLWEIPMLIESFGVNYKYYLRHYSLSIAETILYCVAE